MVTAVTPLPTLSRSDPDFKAKVNALFMTQLPAWTVASNAQALEVNGLANLAETYKNSAAASASTAAGHVTSAAGQVTLAAAQVALAQGYASDAASAAGAALWVSGATIAQYAVVLAPSNRKLYRRMTAAAISITDPASDPTNFAPLGTTLPVAMGASNAIDFGAGDYFVKTIAANTTFTVANVPGGGVRSVRYVEITHTGGVFTLPAGSYWADGVVPQFSTGKVHLLCVTTRNGGTTLRWAALPNYGA